jgi:Tfp pilus assembly protein PilP
MVRCRSWLLPLLVLAGCSKGAEADLQYIGEARSAAAEWALVNEQASKGRLTRAYVESMHRWLREEIRASHSALTEPNSFYGHEIAALLREPDGAPPSELRERSKRLKEVEEKLESA